jgi:hypothetical protein
MLLRDMHAIGIHGWQGGMHAQDLLINFKLSKFN